MPQDANKRKAAKKKNKAKANKKSASSNSHGPRHHHGIYTNYYFQFLHVSASFTNSRNADMLFIASFRFSL